MQLSEIETDPRAFLQLAGHRLRWRLLRDLARSDRTVRELTALADQPQNLVSYHLGKLRTAGLVSSRRSSADGRDSYYRVDLDRFRSMLVASGAALHPGLRLAPSPAPAEPPTGNGPTGEPTRSVLFLCTGNSARSQMAEAFTRVRSGGRIDAHSAGSHPKPLHPDAIRVMRDEYGVDLTDHSPTHLSEFAERRFDRIVTLCDRVREICPEFPGGPEAIHWSMADPSTGPAQGDDDATYANFVSTAAEIDERVGFLLATFASPNSIPAAATGATR